MNPLDLFSPVTRTWFQETYGTPTPPQAQGWLPIQRGEHTLILAPTGSGKTLAAFLWGIDELFRELETTEDGGRTTDDEGRRTKAKRRASNVKRQPSSVVGHSPDEGIHLLYVSPLKALNNDVERNLRVPLEGIRMVAAREKTHLPHLRVAVRTGDTPGSVRASMLKHPPHILITTPESLYLMLTSPRARELFRTTRTVIVDEIHTLAGNKRGAHLAISLERLQHLARRRVQRIGLSATIKPLAEVARFLGGQETGSNEQWAMSKEQEAREGVRDSSSVFRPVTVVDARYQKPLGLEIVTVVEDFRNLPGGSIWAMVIPNVLNDIRRHTTTLIFANNRRLAERTADRLNAQLDAELSEEIPPGSPEALAPGGTMRDRGIFAIGAQGPMRAHHGSMSKEARREMEQDLKAGKLPALVGTSSLELGIDIGAVDLVVQLQSPKSVAQGLQRVGRSGHLVGQTSHGKIYATFREDLAEAAAIARGMLEGDVEPTHTPQNPLDVLAQQIVACVAMQDWDARELYDLMRGAYPYHALPYTAYVSVLEMLTGKYFMEAAGARAVTALRPKIAWDRVHNRLSALPGTRLLALANVGTIPDTGQYPVYLADGKTRIGALDEEFILETRVGDTFLLGSQVWRALDIQDDRVIVADAAGAVPRMPFWHGDMPWRPFQLGERIGRFRREVAERLQTFEVSETSKVLQREYALDEKSARNLIDYVQTQLSSTGALSSDRTIVIETFQNAVGDPYLVIHSPFGGRVNGAWAVALTGALRERTGVTPEVMTNDDGIILRLYASEGGSAADLPLEIVKDMTAERARDYILRDLTDSAVFGAQFRMNAARALLLSKPRAGKRTPFWLQRLKARDLLAYVKRYPDFPLIVETYRDVLSDVFDLPHLEEVLNRIRAGEIQVVTHESLVPSPVASGLLFNFVSTYLYEWDAPKAESRLQLLSVPRQALQEVTQGIEWSELLKPEAVQEAVARAQHLAAGYQARSREELALVLQELGDLTEDAVIARSAGDGAAWLGELAEAGRVTTAQIPTAHGAESRWVAVELADFYRAAFDAAGATGSAETNAVRVSDAERDHAARNILSRFLAAAGPVSPAQILERYGFDARWLDWNLEELARTGELARGHFTTRAHDEWVSAPLLEQIHRRTLTILRGEVQPVSFYNYADFLARWQHVHPAARLRSPDAVETALKQLRGAALSGAIWERELLAARVAEYSESQLEALFEGGEWVWVGEGTEPKRMRVRLFPRGEGALFLPPAETTDLTADARAVYAFLESEGASFATDIQRGTRLDSGALANALAALALRGLVTNDEIETLRNLVEHGAVIRTAKPMDAPPRRTLSALEQELSARLGPRQPTPTRYREARRRTLGKIQRTAAQQASPWRGRWAPVHRASILGAPRTTEETAETWARLLLQRYGVVTRPILERDQVPQLEAVYPVWQRMEWRGEVRRGVFVSGMTGVQYALPEALEQLRAVNGSGGERRALYVLNATDPANVNGGEEHALRFARVPSTFVVLADGEPVLVIQENGERLTTAEGASAEHVHSALQTWFERPQAPRHARVTEWNGKLILGSAGEELLKPLGFYRVPKGMERWKK